MIAAYNAIAITWVDVRPSINELTVINLTSESIGREHPTYSAACSKQRDMFRNTSGTHCIYHHFRRNDTLHWIYHKILSSIRILWNTTAASDGAARIRAHIQIISLLYIATRWKAMIYGVYKIDNIYEWARRLPSLPLPGHGNSINVWRKQPANGGSRNMGKNDVQFSIRFYFMPLG